MEKLTLTEYYLQELTEKTGFQDYGDVDFQSSVLYIDDNGSIVASIVVGNVTNVPTLGEALPENVKDKKGSAQVLLLYMDNISSYGYLYALLREFLGPLLPFKILWCLNSEYTPEILLTRLGFQYHINGIIRTYYMMMN